MRFSIASGTKTVREEAAEWDKRLNGRYSTKSPSDSVMVARIMDVGDAAQKGMLATVLDVKDGKIHISGNSLEELQNKRDIIIRLYDQTYTPSNGLQAYGADPNRSGVPDRNLAPRSWKDPNGRRLS